MSLLLVSLLALGQLPPEADATVDAGSPASNPPAEATGALKDLTWQPLVDLFTEYDWQRATGGGTFDAFAVPRAQLGLEAQWRGVRARVLLEGVYSTQGGALIGTAGDSVVARLREGWGGYRWRFLEARLGMVPTLVVPQLEGAWGLRAVAPDGLEAQRLVAPADLGGTLRGELPRHFGWAAIAVTNGEGYTQRELDGRKNLELAAAVAPIPWLAAPLQVLVGYQNGSTGTTSQRADRFTGGLLWAGEKLGGGLVATHLQGLSDDGGRRGLLLQAFARATLFEHLLLGARLHWLNRDLGGTGADNSWLDGIVSVGAHVVGPLDVFAVFHRAALSPLARASLPGSDVTELRLTLRLRWPLTSTLSLESEP